MASSDDELELLLAFQGVPETPPSSPSRSDPPPPAMATPPSVRSALAEVFGYDSDEEDLTFEKRKASMEVFREVVKLPPKNGASGHGHDNHRTGLPSVRSYSGPIGAASKHVEIESNSRLRIRDRSVSQTQLNNQLLDLRFVPLQAIKIAATGENIKGAWATIGVLAEKGMPKVSSSGQNFAIWKIASLDSTLMPIFLFGDAFKHHYKEPSGCIFVVFNAKSRRDDKRKELSLNISGSNQLLKLGTSVDYGVCKGKRKDGAPCSVVVNRQHGEYCQYHSNVKQQRYKSHRAELNGGNLSTGLAFPHKGRVPQNAGCVEESVSTKCEKPVKIMSVKGLKKVLSNADKVTSKFQSQGIRFLACLAEESKENIKPNSFSKSQNMDTSQLPQFGTNHGLTKCKRKQGALDCDLGQKRAVREQPGESESSKFGPMEKLQSSRPSKNPKCKYVALPPRLLELDLEEEDILDNDNAVAQAMKLFG